jgi:uncharacterized CHY-type Zn-finger protein
MIQLFGHEIFGAGLNASAGCAHYHSELDIVAIKFACCEHYYACCICHQELAAHPIKRWPVDAFHTKAILCRRCGVEHTIEEYLHSKMRCMNCSSPFNPNCKLHWNIYFDWLV